MKKFTADTHSHTRHSCDGFNTPDEMCAEAYARGFDAYAITDHCDVNRDDELDCLGDSSRSVADALRLKREYEGKMQVVVGIEIGNAHRNLPLAERCSELEGIDCIIGSVHRIILDGIEHAGTKINFAGMSDREKGRVIDRYFEEIHLMLDCLTPDILAHPTYMFRYALGEREDSVRIEDHLELLDSVLERIITEGIALEVNTQITDTKLADYDRYMLERYYLLGGRLLTLSSDAHKRENLGKAFSQVRTELRELGFTHGCYVLNREKHAYEL